jgi:hypothetical protein
MLLSHFNYSYLLFDCKLFFVTTALEVCDQHIILEILLCRTTQNKFQEVLICNSDNSAEKG